MKSQTVRLVGPRQREHACHLILNAPDGYVMKLGEETRRDRQNAKLWSMIADIQRQDEDMARYSSDDVKNRFLHALGVEMRFLPELDGQGMFPVGMRSSTLTVKQFAGLIELIYEWGARHDIRWSEPRENL